MSSTTSLLRRLVLLGLALVLVPFFMMLILAPTMSAWDRSHMWNAPMTGGPISPWLSMLLWVVVVVGIIAIGYYLYGAIGDTDAQRSDQAIEELRIAYARGDLSEEEFEQRLERLRNE